MSKWPFHKSTYIRHQSLSLQRRLFVFFLLFLFAVMVGITLILFITGLFSAGRNEINIWLGNELSHISGDIENDYGKLAVESVSLSEKLSAILDRQFKERGIEPSMLQDHPQELEDILAATSETLIMSLGRNKSSGVFFVLDATVNPRLAKAENSRAGVFFKNMEPNIVSVSPQNIRYLRGPGSIAQSNKLNYLPQWELEFAVEPGDFFHKVMSNAADYDLPLSRLFYWRPAENLAGDYDQAMLLCIPVFASDGTPIGVCGFEVSSMLFKLSYIPDHSICRRAFACLAPANTTSFDTSRALFAGNLSRTPSSMDGDMEMIDIKDYISEYIAPDGVLYMGIHENISLYPRDAACEDNWGLAVLMPKSEFQDYISEQNTPVIILLVILLAFFIGMAILFSHRYIKPVVEAINVVKSNDIDQFKKTNIQEIDDLFEYLAAQDATDAPPSDTDLPQLYQDFIKNIETLSPAERAVFNLYTEGYTAKEITNILCLSINTIKTHNRRIYTKLNISSRKELMLFVDMMLEQQNRKTPGNKT